MKWQVVFKSQYTGGYLVTIFESSTLSEVVQRVGDREILSITRIMDE